MAILFVNKKHVVKCELINFLNIAPFRQPYYPVYSKLPAARIFADICQHLRSLAQLIVNKLRASDSNISADN